MNFSDYIDEKIDQWHKAQKSGCMCITEKPKCHYCANGYTVPLADFIDKHVKIWRDRYLSTPHENYDRVMKELF